jgi:hypothetical protein
MMQRPREAPREAQFDNNNNAPNQQNVGDQLMQAQRAEYARMQDEYD